MKYRQYYIAIASNAQNGSKVQFNGTLRDKDNLLIKLPMCGGSAAVIYYIEYTGGKFQTEVKFT